MKSILFLWACCLCAGIQPAEGRTPDARMLCEEPDASQAEGALLVLPVATHDFGNVRRKGGDPKRPATS